MVTEFAYVFQTNESLVQQSQNFVFCYKTVKDISKNIQNQLTLQNFFAFVSLSIASFI